MSIFLSYARADDERFVKRLYSDLTREGFDVWWDRERMPGRGNEFSEELRNAIDLVDRLILVIGPSAVESKVVEQEWRYALSKCKVINPILRLGSHKLLPGRLPKLDIPDFRDDREYNSRLRYLIRQLKQVVGPLASLHDIPKGQEWYIDRQADVDNAVAMLLDDPFRPAIGKFAKMIALQGMPGIGKSAIAAMVAEDCSVRRRFSDGAFWVSMGKTPSINTGMAKIGAVFGDDWQEYPDEKRGKARLGQLLADKSVLVVLDDVWVPEPAEAFAQTLGSRCAVVVTTRQKLELANLTIGQLTDAQGLRMINQRLDSRPDASAPSSLIQQETYRKIVQLLRGHTQAISLAAAQLAHRGADFAPRLLERLQQHLESDSPLKDLELPDHEERQFNMEASFAASYEDLSDEMKRRFRALGVFARGEAFETQAAVEVWSDLSTNVELAEDALDYFVDAALLNRDAERHYMQHDLLHAYARALLEHAGEIESIHQRHFVYYSGKYDKAGLERNVQERQALIIQDLANIREALLWSLREPEWQDFYTSNGVHLFRVVSEELTRSQLLDQLRSLLSDSSQYRLPNRQSELWPVYYQARLAEIEGQKEPASLIFRDIAADDEAGDLLRAYALIDLGRIVRSTNLHDALSIFARVQTIFPEPDVLAEPDAKLGSYLLEVGALYKRQGRWDESLAYFQRARRLFERIGDTYWLIFTENRIKYFYFDRGMWSEGQAARGRGLQELARFDGTGRQAYLKAELLGGGAVGMLWSGSYHQTEQELREALQSAEQAGREMQQIYFLRDLGLTLGLEGKLQESQQIFSRGKALGSRRDLAYEAVAKAFQGYVELNQSNLPEAERYLKRALVDHIQYITGQAFEVTKILNWMGMLAEAQHDFQTATVFYKESIELKSLEEWYWFTGAWLGLARVAFKQRNRNALVAALKQVTETAARYHYNDHFAFQQILSGHLAWQKRFSVWGRGFDKAFEHYQKSLTYALLYNRFLLDEALSGTAGPRLLPSILHVCKQHESRGRDMLIRLRAWWSTGRLASEVSNTTSPLRLSEGISFIEVEELSRSQEPGDGEHQYRVLDQIDQALG